MKTKSTNKVFDLWLFIADRKKSEVADEDILNSIRVWALYAHGLTEKEILKKGWSLHDDWLKEVKVEVNIELTAREIEFLKALKVLGFSWIARDEDDELYAYVSKPTKKSFSHSSTFSSFFLDEDLFSFITWEDEEATSIDEMLKEI